MWEQSLRSASDGRLVIDLTESEGPGQDLKGEGDTSQDSSSECAMPGPAKRVRREPQSQVTSRNFVHFLRPAQNVQSWTASTQFHMIAAEAALSLYADPEHAGFPLEVAHDWDWQSPQPESSAEALAQGCLRGRWIYFKQVRRLFDVLPTKTHERHVTSLFGTDVQPRSITLGACIHGGIASVHTRTKANIWTTRLLCAIVRTLSPETLFSSVFLHLNVASEVHVDSHNHPMIDNTLIPLSVWQGGELWHECLDGDVQLTIGGPKGCLRSIVMPCLRFNSRLRHAALPWSGDRFVLGSYHIRDEWRLSSEDMQFLTEQGFQLQCLGRAVQDPYQED